MVLNHYGNFWTYCARPKAESCSRGVIMVAMKAFVDQRIDVLIEDGMNVVELDKDEYSCGKLVL